MINELKQVLEYSPKSGIFTWKVTRWRAYAGTIAGTKTRAGYIDITYKQKHYYAHRLAWAFMTGNWPKADIDHINGKGDDNRWENLREATRSQNMMNAQKQLFGKNPYKGVSWSNITKKWHAYIWVNGNRRHLGYYSSSEEAKMAYNIAARELFGDFARYN